MQRVTQEGLAELPRPLVGVCLGMKPIQRASDPRRAEAEVRCWSRVSEEGRFKRRPEHASWGQAWDGLGPTGRPSRWRLLEPT